MKRNKSTARRRIINLSQTIQYENYNSQTKIIIRSPCIFRESFKFLSITYLKQENRGYSYNYVFIEIQYTYKYFIILCF